MIPTPFPSTWTRVLLIIACMAALPLAACASGPDATALEEAPVGEPLLPDLTVLPIDHLRVGVTDLGRHHLRFTAALANVGPGSFLLTATRDGDEWSVKQHVAYSESGYTVHPFEGSMVFGGDGHDHWHLRDAAEYRLVAPSAPDLQPLHAEKAGFCFFDQEMFDESLAEASAEAQHDSEDCGHEDADESRMGLSVGWSDPYPWFLPGQSIDVTDLPEGVYRIEVIADPVGWFTEATTVNNVAWVEFELTSRVGDDLPLLEILDQSSSQ